MIAWPIAFVITWKTVLDASLDLSPAHLMVKFQSHKFSWPTLISHST